MVKDREILLEKLVSKKCYTIAQFQKHRLDLKREIYSLNPQSKWFKKVENALKSNDLKLKKLIFDVDKSNLRTIETISNFNKNASLYLRVIEIMMIIAFCIFMVKFIFPFWK